MMFAYRDYEQDPIVETCDVDLLVVSVQDYFKRDYSVVNVHCKDRTNLLYDVVCTLTDMEYVVFHATIDTSTDRASFEFFIKHMDGSPISSEGEKQRVILCLRVAIERRASQGVRLELCTSNRKGLLADVTRTFRENELNVTRVEISTATDMMLNIFYVTRPSS
ncbi:act domain-containing protein acr8 [Phtheirospermum japonicum]|uniref:ACT domain-containing protein ACR n=1 Tax=Phtheirospermum japonicum TaxID=374723 RepID=A0A830BH48_9LAMI|nr:act domain-containing protein acr8 [Phtheirospermum japonicum]